MQCWIVEGHRGAGKSLYAVMKARDYLNRGRMVASNLTLHLDQLMPPSSKACYRKLPGVPRAKDMRELGHAYYERIQGKPGTGPDGDGWDWHGSYDEKKNGLVILDEAGSWLNTREWNDKDRKGVYAWLTQSRKWGFDLLLLIQDWEALDAQIRRALVDTHVTAMCTDRIKLPFLPIKAPKMHMYFGHYKGPGGALVGREFTRGTHLFQCYDTAEKIKVDETLTEDGEVIDARGAYTGLSAWYLVGRYLPKALPAWLWLPLILKWTLAIPSLVMDAKSAAPKLRIDLALMMPKSFPVIAAAMENRRKERLSRLAKKPEHPRCMAPSHNAYRLARYRKAGAQ